jgi:hypothetical protein
LRREGGRVREITDYSGEFDPGIAYKDFSKDFLLKALKVYSHYIRKLDGIWYLTAKQQAGDDLALACDMQVWDEMEVHDVEMTCKLFNVQSNDVTAMFKSLQMSPHSWNLEHHFELLSPDRGIWTVTRCPSLLALEREGQGRERRICQVQETKNYALRARTLNPNMKVIPLKLPPRQNSDEIHCQWEFRIEPP